jgi:hypothetical protein
MELRLTVGPGPPHSSIGYLPARATGRIAAVYGASALRPVAQTAPARGNRRQQQRWSSHAKRGPNKQGRSGARRHSRKRPVWKKTGDAECLLTFHCLSRRFAAPLAGGVAHRPCNVANDRYPRGHEFTAVLLRPSEPCPIGMPSQPQGPRSDRKTPRCAGQRRPRLLHVRGDLAGSKPVRRPAKKNLAGATGGVVYAPLA